MNTDQHRAVSTLAASDTHLRAVAEMVLGTRYPDARPRCDSSHAVEAPLPGELSLAMPLPAAQDLTPTRALASVIVSRRSGGLSAAPIGASTLGTLLAATSVTPPCLPDSTFGPTIYPVIFAIDGIPAGAFRYAPDIHALVPIREIDRTTFGTRAILQREHSTGVALLFLVVPLARWLEMFGDRGYRGAAFAAGWLTDRLYLVAETLGLTYTATGGFAPLVIDEMLGLDGSCRTAFFAFAVGGHRQAAMHGDATR